MGIQQPRSPVTLVCPLCSYSPGPEPVDTCPRDGRLLVDVAEYRKSPNDRYLGTRLAGKYPLLGILGIGGMSTVYRGVQEPVGREVAVKVVSAEADNQNAVRERFQREAQVIARLQHPNIVTMFDFGVEPDGTLFMVQERVEGRDLAQVIKETGPLGLERSARIALQVLAALAEAHARNLVHRDMKPENIMLTPTLWGGEQAKVLDFGIARVMERASGDQERLTKAGLIFGTPYYMSPEQVAGSAEIGFPSDVYSIGIVLYEMLTGEVPFAANSFIDILLAHRTQQLPRLPERLGIPLAVEEVIRRASAKDQRQRFANAGEMLLALEAALGTGTLASLLAVTPGSPLPSSARSTTPATVPSGEALPCPTPVAPPDSYVLDDEIGDRQEPPSGREAQSHEGSVRVEARGTMVLGGAEAPVPESRPSRAKAAAADPVHSRPTLVVSEEMLRPAEPRLQGPPMPLKPPGRRRASHEVRKASPGDETVIARAPLTPPAPAMRPADDLDVHAPGVATQLIAIEPDRPRHHKTPAAPRASGSMLAWILMGVGLVVLGLALVLLYHALG